MTEVKPFGYFKELQIACLLLFGLLLGCQGEPGRDGINLLGGDLQPPTVTINHPMAGQPISRVSIAELNILEEDSVDNVRFSLDNELREFDFLYSIGSLWQFRMDLSSLDSGHHTLQAVVSDRMGRKGYSQTLFFDFPTTVVVDTIRYYQDAERLNVEWRLPDREPDRFTGYGVRFTPIDSCQLMEMWIHMSDDTSAWNSNFRPEMHICESVDGMPGDTINTKWFSKRQEGYLNFQSRDIFVSGDYFALIDIPEQLELTGDTLVLMSDNAIRNSNHSYIRVGDQWKLVEEVMGKPYNFLLDAVVDYSKEP